MIVMQTLLSPVMTLDLELLPEDTNESFAVRNTELFLQHRIHFFGLGGLGESSWTVR